MSRVLLGESYTLRFDPKLWQAMQPYPPLGALYAASFLRSRGHEVAFYDAMLASSEDEWAAALDREKPEIAVLFEDNFNYLSKMCLLRMREAAFTMIDMARSRGATVIVAGSDASDRPGEYLARGADYAIIGEGEHTLGEIVDHLASPSKASPRGIAGLAFLDSREPGTVFRSPRRPPIEDLDSLPFPAWDLVDIERYREIWLSRHGYYSMNMVTARGCPFHCTWCAKPIWGKSYHTRSPDNVVQELKWLKDTHRVDHIWFCDDQLGLESGWIQRFADLVEQHAAKVPFKSLHRADLLLRGDTIEALARAGAKTVWLGAESGSQKILDAMDKGTRVEQIYEATGRLHEAGIEVCLFLQFGYPGEGLPDIEKTLRMVRECRPDDIGMSVAYPLPGTRFFESVRKHLGGQQNWRDSSDMAMLYQGPFPTAFYRQLHVVLHKEFRARKAMTSLGRAMRRPRSFRPRHLRQAAALAYRVVTLPLARLRLGRLSRAPHEAVGPRALLEPRETQQATARPD